MERNLMIALLVLMQIDFLVHLINSVSYLFMVTCAPDG